MKSDILNLIKQTESIDSAGMPRKAETSRSVFCGVYSVGASEWHSAARDGLNPEKRFDVFFGDYDGESVCEYAGQRLAIYRTYERGDTVEIYTAKRGRADG